MARNCRFRGLHVAKSLFAIAFLGRSRTRHFLELCRRHVGQLAERENEGTVVVKTASEGERIGITFVLASSTRASALAATCRTAGPFAGAGQFALEFLRQLVGELVLRDADRVGLGFIDENSTTNSSCDDQRRFDGKVVGAAVGSEVRPRCLSP